MEIFHSPNPENPSTRGVAIVLNREITNTKDVKVHYLIPGRAILAVLPWHGKLTHTVLGVYAPAESMEDNEAFWDELSNLWMTIDLPAPDSLAGDTNIVEEPIDRLPHRRDGEKATAALARFKRLVGLQDGYRKINPDTKAYTYTSTRLTLSRLDRIYVPEDQMKNYRNWAISDAAGGLSDHKLVSVELIAPGSPYIGKGRYTIPLFLLRDKEFMTYTVQEGCALESKITGESENKSTIQLGFKDFKDKITDFARKRAKVAIGALEQKKRSLQEEQKTILKGPILRGKGNDDGQKPGSVAIQSLIV
ncbi:hypothetical protein C8R43DRAFT_1089253 [Mycena crocata]|nr:hypothetical protein C8R43DRAFT_1089253 [Mycena crocata]